MLRFAALCGMLMYANAMPNSSVVFETPEQAAMANFGAFENPATFLLGQDCCAAPLDPTPRFPTTYAPAFSATPAYNAFASIPDMFSPQPLAAPAITQSTIQWASTAQMALAGIDPNSFDPLPPAPVFTFNASPMIPTNANPAFVNTRPIALPPYWAGDPFFDALDAPEPATSALLGAALGGIWWLRNRRTRNRS